MSKAVDRTLFTLKVLPDWFMKQELVEMWQVMAAEPWLYN